jgi:hypothetical protein
VSRTGQNARRTAIAELSSRGFLRLHAIGNIIVMGKQTLTPFRCSGDLIPVASQSRFASSISFVEGMLVLVFPSDTKPQLATWEPFWILESEILTRSVLSFRDYFDDSFAKEMRQNSQTGLPSLGPYWCYLYESINFVEQLSNAQLRISPPLLGNALHCRGDTVDETLRDHQRMRQFVGEMIPLPIAWMHPSDMPTSVVDLVFDQVTADWFSIQCRTPCGTRSLALVDLVSSLRREVQFVRCVQRKPTTEELELEPEQCVIHVRQLNGPFRSRRKLTSLTIQVT